MIFHQLISFEQKRLTMKKANLTLLTFIAAALLTTVTGCGTHQQVTRMSSSSTHGRELSAEIDGAATFKQDGNDHVIRFDGHELVVRKDWLVLDGDKGQFGIPADARKIEIKIARAVLTMKVDGSELIRTPL
jgi:hypothetical protein